MKTSTPKVLHEVAGRSMVNWVVEAVRATAPETVVVVTSAGAADVEAVLPPDVQTCVQPEQLGTAHATQVALEHIGPVEGDIVVVTPGDTPLLRPDTMRELVDMHRRTGSAVTLLTMELPDPTGYGRVLRDGTERVIGIVEHKDGDDAQRAVREVNGGVYAFDGGLLQEMLGRVGRDNVQGEYYLPDVIAMLAEKGHSLSALRTSPAELAGVNSQDQLADVARVMRRRINTQWMQSGVWMQDPDRVYIDAGVKLAPDVRLYAGVRLEGSTEVGEGAEVGPDSLVRDSVIGAGAHVWYSVLRGAEVGEEAEVGPYASLRPGTRLGPRTKAGTFVEMKNTSVAEGAKVPHLSYMGDAEIGERANIGAGTITCNYDGFEKHRTVVKPGARVGSDTMLVAPVTIGEGAFTGAGSVITQDVSDGALAVERSPQREIPGYAARRAERHERSKEGS
jgi:bifunctional UDP-N-acetylglucosamine pyrophosphorylase/glucosamine-1-phosphate N-acetyltransferase